MPEFALKPSLVTLPLELMGIIFPYHRSLDVPLEQDFYFEHTADLRSVSHTCRRLREFALPLVWARVEVDSVRELGATWKLLRASPFIAPLIKSFRFQWGMGGDCEDLQLQAYPDAYGTTLDLAFLDRRHLFDGRMKELGSAVVCRDDYLEHFDRVYIPPGEDPDWGTVREQGAAAYDWLAGEGGRGPDGQGEDKLIKNPAQLTQCFVDILKSLSSLETFGWETGVTPMPRPVFDELLARLATLSDLRLAFSTCRTDLCELPLWELVGNLRALSVELGYGEDRYYVPQDETDEASVTMIERRIAKLLKEGKEQDTKKKIAEDAFHNSIACHIIVAAAKGGRLRRLDWDYYLEAAFAIRTLLPYWLQIEDWGERTTAMGPGWSGAAQLLRPFLAHASLRRDWLASASRGSLELDRQLTPQDLQAVQRSLEKEECDEVTWFPDETYEPVVKYYLPWLAEDVGLAQQVLVVWNSSVERGEADKIKCPCEACSGPRHELE